MLAQADVRSTIEAARYLHLAIVFDRFTAAQRSIHLGADLHKCCHVVPPAFILASEEGREVDAECTDMMAAMISSSANDSRTSEWYKWLYTCFPDPDVNQHTIQDVLKVLPYRVGLEYVEKYVMWFRQSAWVQILAAQLVSELIPGLNDKHESNTVGYCKEYWKFLEDDFNISRRCGRMWVFTVRLPPVLPKQGAFPELSITFAKTLVQYIYDSPIPAKLEAQRFCDELVAHINRNDIMTRRSRLYPEKRIISNEESLDKKQLEANQLKSLHVGRPKMWNSYQSTSTTQGQLFDENSEHDWPSEEVSASKKGRMTLVQSSVET